MKCNAKNRINNQIDETYTRDKALLIERTGKIHYVQNFYPSLKRMKKLINCETVQFVPTIPLERVRGLDMIELCIDEEGFYSEDPVVNKKASLLYGTQYGAPSIVGDVLVVKYDPEKGETIPLTNMEIAKILTFILHCDENKIPDKIVSPKITFVSC